MDLVNPQILIPHEDVDLENLKEILNLIKITKKIKPIIVDYNLKIIIDGHHRWLASRILNLKKIPAILIDYHDTRVRVGSWYIKVKNELIFKNMIKSYSNSNGEICVTFKNLKFCEENYYKFYWRLYSVLQTLRKFNIIEKSDRDGYELPEVEKDFIIKLSKTGNTLPPKTTRHSYEFIIPQFTFPINELL